MEHEEAIVRGFIRRDKRQRYLEKLAKDRAWVLRRIDVMADADSRFMTEVTGPLGNQGRSQVFELLKSKGAPEMCFVLGGGELDGREMRLEDALDEVVGLPSLDQASGAIVSCLPGRLAYLESASGRYLLARD